MRTGVRERLRDPDYVARRRWPATVVLCVSLTVIGLDSTVLNVALPTLARPPSAGGLGASASELQWIVDAYTLVFAGLLLTAGSLGDRFGRYRALVFGLTVFGIGSVLSATAASAQMLIGTRALMGIGGAFIMPATLSTITNIFTNSHERARAIGLWAGISAIGVAIGPVVGGLLLRHFWWGSVFLVNIPIVVISLVFGYLLVPDSRDRSARPLDPVGSLLSIAGLVALLWGLIEGPSHGWTSPEILVAFGIAATVGGAFVGWELHRSHPMLDLRFFRNPRFSAASGAIMLTFLALYGLLFLQTQYLQLALGFSPIAAGAILLPTSAAMSVLAFTSPHVVQRLGSKIVVAGGMATLAAALALMGTLDAHSTVLHVILVTMLVGVGMAYTLAPATESIMGSLPRDQAGVGSAMNDTTRLVGGSIGVALLGSITASTFSSEVTNRLRGLVPASQLEAARDSIGAALGVARSAGASGDRVADVARDSFVTAMHVAMLVGSVVVAVGVVAVLIWLPARATDDDVEHVSFSDVIPSGLTPVDVLPAEQLVEVAEELGFQRGGG
jgi:EmrB/QacA subfamily drug resistance transporter